MQVRELNDADFRAALAEAQVVFVDFYASWCGSCRLFAPTFDQVAGRHPQYKFFKIDGDVNADSRSELSIGNLPYIAAYRDGKFVDGISTTTDEGFDEFVRKVGSKS
jgi:thioredoxin 1